MYYVHDLYIFVIVFIIGFVQIYVPRRVCGRSLTSIAREEQIRLYIFYLTILQTETVSQIHIRTRKSNEKAIVIFWLKNLR